MTVDWVLRVAGALILIAVMQDIFVTVLFPASGHGLIRRPTNRAVWSLIRALAARLASDRRRRLLAYSGPLLVAVTLLAWMLALTAGWALVFKPVLGSAIVSSSGPTDTGWATAFYFSGYALTTLGTGDVVPRTGAYRILTVVEAGTGFATISMTVTYFLSVYSNLTQRNAFAASLHHRTRDTGDAVELIVGLADGDRLTEARGFLVSSAHSLQRLYETHRFYPVLRYFHYRHPYYALPYLLSLALDTAALLSTALDGDRYPGLAGRASAPDLLTASALQLADDLVPAASRASSPRPVGEEPGPVAEDWRKRYRSAVRRLDEAGLRVNPDPTSGAEQYIDLRARWDPQVASLARSMLYEWDPAAPVPSALLLDGSRR